MAEGSGTEGLRSGSVVSSSASLLEDLSNTGTKKNSIEDRRRIRQRRARRNIQADDIAPRFAGPKLSPTKQTDNPASGEAGIKTAATNEQRQVPGPSGATEFVVTGGNYQAAAFGPQTHIKGDDYAGATINVHHHYSGEASNKEPLSKAKPRQTENRQASDPTGAEMKRNPPDGYVEICKDIFMYYKTPLQKGANVFKGYQEYVTGDRLPLAIKRISPYENKHLREVGHLVRLASHPNVVRIIRSEIYQGRVPELYIVMELCSSQNLQDYLKQNREKNVPFDFDQTMTYTKQLVSGIQHIHRNKVAHRDLKPENILLSLDGGQIKVSDFGISKEIRDGNSTKQTSPGEGTDGYRAPETFKSGDISQSADIFSLGLVMYPMWSNGKHAFGGDVHMRNPNIIYNRGRDLSGLVNAGNKGNQLRNLIDWMLQPDPKKRPTIEQVAQHPFFKSGPSPSVEDPNNNVISSQQQGMKPSLQKPTNEHTLTERSRPKLHQPSAANISPPTPDHLNVSSDEDSTELGSASSIKIKASSHNKAPHHFSHPKQVQDIAVHVGAVWCMKFSHCGRLLATAGQDNVIWVWVLKDFYNYFNDMRNKYVSKEEELFSAAMRHSSHSSSVSESNQPQEDDVFVRDDAGDRRSVSEDEEDSVPFRQVPFSSYVGHSADVLDLAWSKNFFILSSSMDKTVRLWHISRKECLCCFQHFDFVTAIAFHPRDDRYFLSGSLDSKLRLWNIPDKKVALWNEVSPDGSSSSSSTSGGALITTVNFCEGGKFAVCGTYDSRCIFFDTEHLKYHTQIHVRSSRGRNNKGHKITGIEPLHGEHKILVTSNDSRVRLYDLRDLSLVCKYKGHSNTSSQIKASFSPDSKYIICGSEDKCVYIWRTSLPQDVKLSSLRRDRNDAWESIKTHDAVVTCAVFAPQPQLLYKIGSGDTPETKRQMKTSIFHSKKQEPEEVNVIISADFKGCIKVTVCADV